MAKHASTMETVEGKMMDVAEQLGKIIGSARARVDNWKGERQTMVDQLSKVVAEAQDLLKDLGHQAQAAASAVGRAVDRRGTRGGERAKVGRARRKGGRRKGSTLSAEARARISAAQKARWAKIKAVKKK